MLGWKNASIQWKLIRVIVPIVILAMAVIGIVAYQKAENELLLRIEDAASSLVEGYSSDIDTWLESLVDGAKHMSLSTAVRSMDWNQQRTYLEDIPNHFDYIADAWVADTNGQFRKPSGATGSFADREHFQVALQGKANINPRILNSKTSGERIAAVAAPIYDDRQSIAGVLGFTVPIDYIQRQVEGISLTEGSYGFVADGDGLVIAHPDPDLILNLNLLEQAESKELSDGIKAGLAGKSGFVGYTWRGVDMYMAYAPIPTTNWVLGVAIPAQTISSSIAGMRNTTIIVVVLAIIVITVAVIVFVRMTVGRLSILVQHLESMAQGDLALVIKQKTNDEVGRSFGALAKLRAHLAESLREIGEASQTLAHASQELSASTEETGASIEEIASTTNQFAATVTKMSSDAQTMAKTANEISAIAEDGSRAVTNAVDSTKELQDSIARLSQVVAGLSERTNSIGKIVDVIRGIADQTNLLALNAAIEAARAGEHGRGFAVVADEVRQLAEQASQATGQIAEVIKDIQTETAEVVATMESESQKAAESSLTVSQGAQLLNQILAAIKGIIEQIHNVAQGAEEIGRGSQAMAATTEEQSASVEEMAAHAQELSEMAERLDNLVKHFRLE